MNSTRALVFMLLILVLSLSFMCFSRLLANAFQSRTSVRIEKMSFRVC
jgi:hypothetical protein